ncbi:MAG: CcdB family protein [Pseudomonadota bacterium]
MPQFTLYKNKNSKSKADIPLLLDVQSDLLSDLHSRVVIPLYAKRADSMKPINKLMPELVLEGKQFILATPQLAGVALQDLGEPAGSLNQYRSEVIAALDMLITGI